MLNKLTMPLLAATVALGAITTTSEPAEARRGARIAAGVAAGIIGLGILGAYAHARPRYYGGSCYRVGGGCYWKEGRCYHNRYGDYVCARGYQVCERARTVCD